MTQGVSNTIVAVLATSAGVAVTLLLTWLFVDDHPELRAAEQRFTELPHSEARRLIATFDRLQNSPGERRHIEEIHKAVSNDPDIDRRLQQLYAWWQTRDDAQRAELREVPVDRWIDEMQWQISEFAETHDFTVQLPGPLRRRGSIHVSRQKVDRFLEDALPADGLSPDDEDLLKLVEPEDLSLARVLVILRRLFRSRSGKAGMGRGEVARISQAAETHILRERILEDRRDPGGEAMVSFAILRSLELQLREEFVRRHVVSSEAVEREFTGLDTPARIKHMMSDPATALRSLQMSLKSADRNTPAGRLAVRLSEFNHMRTELRRMFPRVQRSVRGQPGVDRRREPGRGRELGPPRGHRQPQPRFSEIRS